MLTKDKVNEKLKTDGRGIHLSGEYLGSLIKTEFTCSKGHSWNATPNSVTKKNPSGCPHCSGKFPYTSQTINEKLSSRGIKFIGEYINAHTKSTFECKNGHQWVTTPASVLSGCGCDICAREDRKVSKEEINRRLFQDKRGYELIGDFKDTNSRAIFKCSNNHTWTTVVAAVVYNKTLCPYCTEYYLSKDVINKRIKESNREIELVGKYLGNHINSLFRCGEHHEFMASPSNILTGRGCPHCATYGFNPSIPGYSYLLKFDGFIKYGITNNIDQRLKQHLKNGKFSVCVIKRFEVGSEAREWETTIKKTYGGKYVTDALCPDGWTETLPVTLLEEVSKTLTINKKY